MSERPITQTICNALWGNQLSFRPFTRGDAPIIFSSLWPGKQTLVEAYADANIEDAPYELCKLLVATNSAKSLDALLEERILQVNQSFNPGCVTLAHLACAVGVGEVIQVLARRSQTNNGVWSLKDEEERTPSDVCFHSELKRFLPGRSSIFKQKKVPQGMPLKNLNRDEIFDKARSPDSFYWVVVQLQVFIFDVNRIRNKEGDLLIHVAVKGGLPQLPLLLTLVRNFKADVTLPDGQGLSPLCLACKRGEERVAEVLICVHGADINAPTPKNGKTPLHWAVEHNHPSVVSMLLRRGADSNREDQNRCIPSFVARRHRYHECKQIIMQYQRERVARLGGEASEGTLDVSRLYPSDSSIVTSSGYTLLMLAATNNQEATVRELTKMEHCPLDFKQMKSSDLFNSDDFGGSSSSWRDMSPDPDYSLKTAVHMAAENGFPGCLLALLEAGAHPAILDGVMSWLPLHYACDNGHLNCVNTIVTFPNQLGLSGLRPAIDIAKENGHDEIVKLLEKAIERRQVELVTPLLFECAHSGNTDLFAILENGDNVNPTNEAHDWPLILTAGFGHLDLVQQLHEFGGHVTRKHLLSRSTPLHVAARGGHKEVVRYLLQFCVKADGTCPPLPFPLGSVVNDQPARLYINDRNTGGYTPLELAVSQGARDVVRLLLDHGASTTLPDSNGCQLNCPSFAGTQFMMETHRKTKKKRILACLSQKATLRDIQKVWGGPSDFNLSKKSEDSLIMLAAQDARPEVLQFLIDEAAKCKQDMLVSAGPPLQLSGFHSSSAEESSPDFLENSLPPNFKPGSSQPYPQTALPAPRSHYDARGKSPEAKATPLNDSLNPFPQTALPALQNQRSRGKSPEKSFGASLNPFPQTTVPVSQNQHSRSKKEMGASLNPFPPDRLSTVPSHNPLGKQPRDAVPPLQPSPNPFPQTALPAARSHKSRGKSPNKTAGGDLNPFPQTALPAACSQKSRGKSSDNRPVADLNPFPQTALPAPRSHNPHKKPEVTVTSLGPMYPLSDTSSDMCDGGTRKMGGDKELLRNHTAMPTVVRSQVTSSDRHYQTDQGSIRRKQPPKKPPRMRHRVQSVDMAPRPVALLRKKGSSGGSSATPFSDEEEDHRRLNSSKVGAVANGYEGRISSGAESGAEGKTKEFMKLVRFVNPADGCTALHRAAEACRFDNVTVLLKADEELANMQDLVGNTALHLACSKGHKQTVKALLGFKCVITIIRNAGNEQVEDRCMRRDVRKMVAKARQLQYGDKIPEWNGTPKQPQGMASVGKAVYGESRLPNIHETNTLVVDQEQKFEAHFQVLKDEYDKKHDTTNSS